MTREILILMFIPVFSFGIATLVAIITQLIDEYKHRDKSDF